LLVMVVSGATAWFRAYSSIAPYDDEGGLVFTIRQFLGGQPLYDGVRTIYGPLYYICEWIPHAIAGVPVTPDSVRVLDVAFWIAAGLVLFALMYRATGSLIAALAAHLVGFRIMDFIGVEASHPQEICAVFLFAVPLAACARRSLVRMMWLGALAAAALLTKTNFGMFVALSVPLAWIFLLPRGNLRRVLFPAAGAIAMVLPFALMSAHLAERWALRYALLAAASLLCVLLVSGAAKAERFHVRDLVLAGAAALATGALLCWPVLARGTTIAGMYWSLLVWPREHFAQAWFLPLPVTALALLWAGVNVILAGLASSGRLSHAAIACLKAAFVTLLIVAGVRHYAAFLCLATPMLWLVLVTPAPSAAVADAPMLRPLLAVFGAINVLYAYPVAGQQPAFASVLIVPCAILCAFDALRFLNARLGGTLLENRRLAGAAALILVALYGVSTLRVLQQFRSMEPLGLPGAERLRADPGVADSLRRIVSAAKNCTVLASQPGFMTLNLLSGVPAPAGLRGGPWSTMLGDAEQQSIVREMEQHPRACVVDSPKILQVWTLGREVPDRAIVRYISERFRMEFETGDYRFLVRK
jgi:hypothetical protein